MYIMYARCEVSNFDRSIVYASADNICSQCNFFFFNKLPHTRSLMTPPETLSCIICLMKHSRFARMPLFRIRNWIIKWNLNSTPLRFARSIMTSKHARPCQTGIGRTGVLVATDHTYLLWRISTNYMYIEKSQTLIYIGLVRGCFRLGGVLYIDSDGTAPIGPLFVYTVFVKLLKHCLRHQFLFLSIASASIYFNIPKTYTRYTHDIQSTRSAMATNQQPSIHQMVKSIANVHITYIFSDICLRFCIALPFPSHHHPHCAPDDGRRRPIMQINQFIHGLVERESARSVTHTTKKGVLCICGDGLCIFAVVVRLCSTPGMCVRGILVAVLWNFYFAFCAVW